MARSPLEALRRSLGLARSAPTRAELEVAAELFPREVAETQSVVEVTPTPITTGERVTIRYRGPLGQHGGRVYLHYGFGPGPWRQVQDVPMQPTGHGTWEATVYASDGGRLAFCFHDEANRWDNNGGRDWSYEIHQGD